MLNYPVPSASLRDLVKDKMKKTTTLIQDVTTELLLSLPAKAAEAFDDIAPNRGDNIFVASDPPGRQLGSGGGTAHLLTEAWKAAGQTLSFSDWINDKRKLMIHGSGQSRRLPAYAAEGKPLTPVPVMAGKSGQKYDQLLLDLQRNAYDRFFRQASNQYRLMVTCGDVMIHFDRSLPVYPKVDVLIVGLMASAEEAQRHGVLVCPTNEPGTLSYFLQKPSIDDLHELSDLSSYYLDTGIWMLSERAILTLMKKCGWRDDLQSFVDGQVDFYDMFSAFGPSLGSSAYERHRDDVDADVQSLSCAVLPLQDGRFYHFGTSRSVFSSVSQLQNPVADQRSFGDGTSDMRGNPIVQYSEVASELRPENRNIWIDNSCIATNWKFSERNIVTGAPKNNWNIELPPGICLDFVPISESKICIRTYGFDDQFRGKLGDVKTLWMDCPAVAWFESRQLDINECSFDLSVDIQESAIFPVLDISELDQDFIDWLISPEPVHSPDMSMRWRESLRFSANDILQNADISQSFKRRQSYLTKKLNGTSFDMWKKSGNSIDLDATASLINRCKVKLPDTTDVNKLECDLEYVHERMFRSVTARNSNQALADQYEQQAFTGLRELIIGGAGVNPVKPSKNILDDQIIWGRSPIRLDLAGGWSDTPPYCLEYGGSVVNVAVDLNGQPPIQVFARVSDDPSIVIRSIDLGLEDRITSYADLQELGKLGSGFGIARAALALAGLSPEFHINGGYDSLQQQLKKEFGGGIEISMLAAIPKGSGLGTSSILSATLLGTLSELCGHYWTMDDLFIRTMALEQMLTSGGGWQDQAGGIFGGIKLLETKPGLTQNAVVRWLPDDLLSGDNVNKRVLLYYTGITRVAHNILGEIVRKIFLNSSKQHAIINDIKANSRFAADAIQRNDWDGLCESVRRSWHMNQELDSGTNPSSVQKILDIAGEDVAAAKLLGAGGGGYMLILTRDADAGQRVRKRLNENPPNVRARFIDMRVSDTGFQVTRS